MAEGGSLALTCRRVDETDIMLGVSPVDADERGVISHHSPPYREWVRVRGTCWPEPCEIVIVEPAEAGHHLSSRCRAKATGGCAKRLLEASASAFHSRFVTPARHVLSSLQL